MNNRHIVLAALGVGLLLGVFAACGSGSKCSAATCAGCCATDGSCKTGNEGSACGKSGVTCSACFASQACTAGACVSTGTGGGTGGGVGGGAGGGGGDAGTPDAGGATGAPCSANTDCLGNFCYDEATNPTYLGGYCSDDCSTDPCPTGASCVNQIDCEANCATPGTQATCRTGYICDKFLTDNDPNQGVCTPSCAKDPDSCALDDGGTATCESNGFCCGLQYFKCCSTGTQCLDGTTCGTDGYCQ
ncbi:MAG: hypothetical protein ACJ790_14285 [Myxococcaceae bacterium]